MFEGWFFLACGFVWPASIAQKAGVLALPIYGTWAFTDFSILVLVARAPDRFDLDRSAVCSCLLWPRIAVFLVLSESFRFIATTYCMDLYDHVGETASLLPVCVFEEIGSPCFPCDLGLVHGQHLSRASSMKLSFLNDIDITLAMVRVAIKWIACGMPLNRKRNYTTLRHASKTGVNMCECYPYAAFSMPLRTWSDLPLWGRAGQQMIQLCGKTKTACRLCRRQWVL